MDQEACRPQYHAAARRRQHASDAGHAPTRGLAGARGYCAYDIEARLGVSVALPADDRLRSRGPLVDPLSRALHRPLELTPLEPVHRSTRHRTRVR